MVTMWVFIATGFTGALTLSFLLRLLYRSVATTPSVMAHFSPKGGVTDVVVSELGRARREVLVLAYSFTSQPIAKALIEAKTRGVHVEIILDHSNETEPYSDLHFFLEQKLTPVIDAHHAIDHNKVMIIDGRTILTGSFNFTHQAENENAENLLVIKGHPDLVQLYRSNFEVHKEHARAAEAKVAPAVNPATRSASGPAGKPGAAHQKVPAIHIDSVPKHAA
jgi:phosphatidylserine/phosphatidylglycerophosphate/cardiolipin synthase-like enzyme